MRLSDLHQKVTLLSPVQSIGRVSRYIGTVIEVEGLKGCIGDYCLVRSSIEDREIKAEVVGFRNNKLMLMPFSQVRGITAGDLVIKTERRADIPVGKSLLGRVVDPFCEPLDELGPVSSDVFKPVYPEPSNPLNKMAVTEQLDTKIRVIDCIHPIGKGQRVGIFAGSGVGKSSLFNVLSTHVESDVRVIALIGERGREVAELVELLRSTGDMERSVMVVASADQPALVRAHALFSAIAIAESFSELGYDVLMLADSITRHALAQREIGLAIGEPPTLRGYTPSVFAQLPLLIERLGCFKNKGAITGIFTVLVEGDDMDEPVADNMRAILDGHFVLSRRLSDQAQYPSIDILQSRSRVKDNLIKPEYKAAVDKLYQIVNRYETIREMIEISGYTKGESKSTDQIVERYEKLSKWLFYNDGIYAGSYVELMSELERKLR
ncbi:FliI/YscN family ATPase [Pleionea sp. CnH1-48]|uniref:FliI/YscN family ATPase n=1 Tax=Pleionea sp. CnH1-48 TaxID=2954494 RepID=UPI0020973AEC|nr:FliI/YscN family ATPase [Pleionea sp. CnH1-48]